MCEFFGCYYCVLLTVNMLCHVEVMFSPALPDFLSSSGSGTGSTQPREPREVN